MFPTHIGETLKWTCLPRLGGGVSITGDYQALSAVSSPPRRGCFCVRQRVEVEDGVFPASAGVFPVLTDTMAFCPRLPRLGGGVSWPRPRLRPLTLSSPPRRGCFWAPTPTPTPVFPASAGVFPRGAPALDYHRRLPRLGGGVSQAQDHFPGRLWSSPPRRGCFRLIDFVMNYFFDESHYEII